MKKESPDLLIPISKEESRLLTQQVEEKLATSFTNGQHKIFSSADLWNIQRHKKVGYSRRFLV